jgi:hypothetical protein
MKKILLLLVVTLSFMGCSSKSEENKNVEPKLVVGKSLEDFQVKDQHEKPQTLSNDTKIVFFSFSKPVGHTCNEFLSQKPADFLEQHHAVYVADVTPAPSIIKSMFILPDLKKLPFTILLINDEKLSSQYSKGVDKESIVVVFLDNKKITKIENLKTKEDLEKLFKQ